MIERIRRRLADKRTYEGAVLALSVLGSIAQPAHWGMILSGGFVLMTLIELLIPDAYDSTLEITFRRDGAESDSASMDTIG